MYKHKDYKHTMHTGTLPNRTFTHTLICTTHKNTKPNYYWAADTLQAVLPSTCPSRHYCPSHHSCPPTLSWVQQGSSRLWGWLTWSLLLQTVGCADLDGWTQPRQRGRKTRRRKRKEESSVWQNGRKEPALPEGSCELSSVPSQPVSAAQPEGWPERGTRPAALVEKKEL